MEIFIPVIIVTMLLLAQVNMYKNLCRHLAVSYPEAWAELSKNSLGTSLWSITNANVSESLKTGYFSTVEDSKIEAFLRFRRFSLLLGTALILCQCFLIH